MGFLDYLWGIETQVWSWVRLIVPSFLDYLWGIETDSFFDYIPGFRRFLDYLWGIETQYVSPLRRCPRGFLDYLWGIETSGSASLGVLNYIVFRLPMRNWNLDRGERLGQTVTVFRLPMRNWNFLLGSFVASGSIEFLDYLWGIETTFPFRSNDLCRTFLDYLWGIET